MKKRLPKQPLKPNDATRRLTPTLRRTLLASHAEGTAFGAMVGMGETYLPAFVLAIGLGEVTAGLVSSVPLVAGGLMQMVSPAAIRRIGSHKRWVQLCALVQALSFAPLVIASLVGYISAAAVLVVATVYWGAGLATGPAWNTWMGTLVPRSLRAGFFANRTRLSQAAVLAGLVAGGWGLHFGEDRGHTLLAFAALFLAAGLFRLLSVSLLAVQSEPTPLPANMRRVPLRNVWNHLRHTGGGGLLLYFVLVQGAVQFCGPYFAPFMLAELRLSYAEYFVLIGASFLTKILLLPTWGYVAQRVGALALLRIGGFGIVPLSAMWLVSNEFAWVLLIQILGGTFWAAYELALFLLLFESIDVEERTSLLTLYNLANTSAWVGGSLLGGLLLASLGVQRHAYLLLFAVSSVLRALVLPLLMRIPEIRVEAAPMAVRTVGVRPNTASVDAPILPSLPDQTPEAAQEGT